MFKCVGSVHVDGIRFQVFPNDHVPPHAHAWIGDGCVVVDLLPNGVRLAPRPGSARYVKLQEVRRVLSVADANRERLLRMWEEIHGSVDFGR